MKVGFAALGVEHRRFERPDLADEVQVGLIAYTDWDSAQHLQNDPFRFNATVIKDGGRGLTLPSIRDRLSPRFCV